MRGQVSIYEWHGKGLVSLLTGGGDITGIGASIAGIFAYQLAQHAISPHLNDLNPYKLEKGDIATTPSDQACLFCFVPFRTSHLLLATSSVVLPFSDALCSDI